MKIIRTPLRKNVPFSACLLLLIWGLAIVRAPPSYAQSQSPVDPPAKIALLHSAPDGSDTGTSTASAAATAKPAAVPDPAALEKDLAEMKARMEQIETE